MNRRWMPGILALWMLVGCTVAVAGWDPFDEAGAEHAGGLQHDAAKAIAAFRRADPDMQVFFRKAYGYAVFPSVGKGAFWIGGAYGKGAVYRQRRFIGTATLAQLTLGLQAGGQAYREVIFFRDKAALDRFTAGTFRLSAQASAVLATSGASADADYSDGVAIFTLPKGGLMYEVSVGGQAFSFHGGATGTGKGREHLAPVTSLR